MYCPKCDSELDIIVLDCHHPVIDWLECKKCNIKYKPCSATLFGKECKLIKGHKDDHISTDNVLIWPNYRSLV